MSKPPVSRHAADRNTVAALRLVQRLQPALQRGDRGPLVEIIGELVALRAPLAGQWLLLSQAAAQYGEVGLARAAIDLYLDGARDDPAAPYRKAALLSVLGAWDEALELLRSLPGDRPDPGAYAYVRGTAALYVGETDEARHYLVEATRLNPLAGSAWLSLAVLVDFARDADLASHVIGQERAMDGALPSERSIYLYALGKVFADLDEHERAFAAFAGGAALMRRQVTYSRERDAATAAECVDGFAAGRIAALAARQEEPTGRGIFVVGHPRSGTTLAEQILTSHGEVCGGGEIYRMGLLAREIGGLSCHAVSAYAGLGGSAEAARLWRHWLGELFPAPGRVVDKTITNSRMLGIAASLLPDAPLVWLRRDPLDCAWSCFRTRFTGEAPWSCDLEDIACHFRLEDQVFARWRDILGERLLVVPYEELASQPEPWIRRILAHCDLAEEPQVFAPHENARTVTTSSVMQVRRPINRGAIGSAEPYREFLRPFIDAYFT